MSSPSATTPRSHASEGIPPIMRTQAFDLCSFTESFCEAPLSPAERSSAEQSGYVTPPAMNPFPEFPPRFVFKTGPMLEIEWEDDEFDSDLEIPSPDSCAARQDEGEERMWNDRPSLRPRFEVFRNYNYNPLINLSLPSLGDEISSVGGALDERDDQSSYHTRASSKVENAMPYMGYDEKLPVDEQEEARVGVLLPKHEPLSTTYPLNHMAPVRRRSMGAFAA